MRCTVKDIPIYYEIHGSGKPLLLIHGFTPDHRLMSGCFEPLFTVDSGWQRIYLDLPGMGKTPAPDWLTSTDQMLEIVQAFIRQVVKDEPYALTGESYGGYLTRGLLAKDARPIQGVMLLCPAVYADSSRRHVPAHQVMIREAGVMDGLTPDEQNSFDANCVVQTFDVWQKMKRDISCGVDIADRQALERLSKQYAFEDEIILDEVRFDGPALFLVGRQDSVVGYADAMSLLPHFPHATYAVLDYAGHNLQIEQPDVFNALTLEWLLRVEKNWVSGE